MPISVCVAGATGWAGRPVAEAIHQAPDLQLHAAVGRSWAGRDLGTAWEGQPIGVPVRADLGESLTGVDVLVDYTSHASIRAHVLEAVTRGVHVVVGASGLTAKDYADIDAAAREAGVGVIAGGNFSLSAVLAQAAAAMAAVHLPSWEIVDYASSAKADSPSGTAREMAERLRAVHAPAVEWPIASTAGSIEARGVTLAGTQIHSVRLPGFELATEVVFGLPHERLIIRHESGPDAAQFVAGSLLAVRAVSATVGVVRGVETLMLKPRA